MVALQVPGLVSTQRARASADELRGGDESRALELAEDAVAAEPYGASAYVQRALVRQARGELESAAADLWEAIEREPTNWRHPLLLARVAALMGDRQGVQSQLTRARQLTPRSGFLVEGSDFLTELEALQAAGR